jgi:hypothetical protein
MDGPDPLQARILPFRLHRYERWRAEAWEPMREAIPTARERIRRILYAGVGRPWEPSFPFRTCHVGRDEPASHHVREPTPATETIDDT